MLDNLDINRTKLYDKVDLKKICGIVMKQNKYRIQNKIFQIG